MTSNQRFPPIHETLLPGREVEIITGYIDLLKAFKKLEEAGFVDEHLLLVPLAYSD